jgi:hypothetical protein
MPKSRPPYPLEFRQRMVELVRAGRTPEELAEEFEPSAQAIRNWVSPGGQSVPLAGASKCTTQRRAVNVDDPSEPQQGTLPSAGPCPSSAPWRGCGRLRGSGLVLRRSERLVLVSSGRDTAGCGLVGSGSGVAAALQPVAAPLHEDDLDVLQEAVEDRGGGGNITEGSRS